MKLSKWVTFKTWSEVIYLNISWVMSMIRITTKVISLFSQKKQPSIAMLLQKESAYVVKRSRSSKVVPLAQWRKKSSLSIWKFKEIHLMSAEEVEAVKYCHSRMGKCGLGSNRSENENSSWKHSSCPDRTWISNKCLMLCLCCSKWMFILGQQGHAWKRGGWSRWCAVVWGGDRRGAFNITCFMLTCALGNLWCNG